MTFHRPYQSQCFLYPIAAHKNSIKNWKNHASLPYRRRSLKRQIGHFLFSSTFTLDWKVTIFDAKHSKCITLFIDNAFEPIDKFLCVFPLIKGVPLGLRQLLASENPLKLMKIVFYFTSKAFFVFKIFNFLSELFGHVTKRLDKEDKVNFKFYDVRAWLKNNCNTHIAQYLEKVKVIWRWNFVS